MRLLARLLLIFVPATLLTMGVVLVRSRRTARTVLLGELERRGLAETLGLAEALGKVPWDKESALLPYLQVQAEDADGVYAMALDRAGRVAAHTNVVERGRVYTDAETASALGADQPLVREISWGGVRVLDVAAPVWKAQAADREDLMFTGSGRTRLGTVRLGIPLERGLRERSLEVQDELFTRQAALTLLAIGALSVGLVLFIVRVVILPVRALAKGLERVSEGRYGTQLPVRSSDELGRLTAAFNRMSGALRQTTVSKAYLDAILGNMLDPLLVLRLDGTIQSLNRAAERLLGWTQDELAGRPAQTLFAVKPGPFPPGTPPDRWQLQNREVDLATKDGRAVPTLFSCSLIRDQAGEGMGLVCVARDLAERKRLEAQMLQSEKLSAVGQLAAGVAHEINNPLGVILGFAEGMVRRLRPEDPFAMPLKSIEREALRCKNLVQDLLTFSRHGAARAETFDLDAAVRGALTLIETQAKVKSVALAAEFGAPGSVRGSRNNVQQVVINLCTNAIDAMPGGGRLAVRTSSDRDERGTWGVLEVEDSGAGIPPEIRGRIFEPFFTTKDPGKGTGLGLALVHEIVHKHGGTLDFQSDLGKGTVFRVRLPLSPGRRGGPEDARKGDA